jgi:hypothetical protein
LVVADELSSTMSATHGDFTVDVRLRVKASAPRSRRPTRRVAAHWPDCRGGVRVAGFSETRNVVSETAHTAVPSARRIIDHCAARCRSRWHRRDDPARPHVQPARLTQAARRNDSAGARATEASWLFECRRLHPGVRGSLIFFRQRHPQGLAQESCKVRCQQARSACRSCPENTR